MISIPALQNAETELKREIHRPRRNPYLGMNSTLVNGYIAGCNAFDVENGFYSVNTDETTGDTTMKLYIAGKFDMPEIDKMYINDKALEYCNELGDDSISGGSNAGKT